MAQSVLAKMAVLISAQTAEFNKALAASEARLRKFAASAQSTGVSITQALGASALAVGGIQLIRVIDNAINVASDFEASMSEVKAITGASGDEFKELSRDALRLGSSTKFTATEVSKLQVAYGRLGFTTKEILAATGATLDLAAATGEDLAKSADVAGSTVRGFGLSAKETQRIVDVMASSFNKSALGLENFSEAMKYVAPNAKAANITVEETTALLATLADAGIRGSMAGTSLRKIITDLSKDGRPLKDRLKELADRGITLSDAFDEVGRTAQTSLLILAENTEKTDALAKSFKNVTGEAASMARVMQDNLNGDVTKLSSAFEGLFIKINQNKSFREFIQQFTSFVTYIQSGQEDIDKIFKNIGYVLSNNDLNKFSDRDISANLKRYVDDLKEVRREAGKPFDTKLIEDLANKYNLSSRGAYLLKQAIEEANTALSFQERAIEKFNKFAEKNGYDDLKKAADDYIASINKSIIEETNRNQSLKQLIISANGVKNIFSEQTEKDKAASDELIASYLRTIDIVRELTNESSGPADAALKTIDSLDELQKKLDQLNTKFASATDRNDTDALQSIGAEIIAIQNLIDSINAYRRANDEKNKQKKKEFALFNAERQSIYGLAASYVKLQEDIKKAQEELAKYLNSFNQVSKLPEQIKINDQLRAQIDGITSTVRKAAKELIDLGPIVSNAVAGIADAFGSALGTGDFSNFGDAILRAVADFAKQLGSLMISIGVGELALQSGNPYVMIAAGAALVAAGAALSAHLEKQKTLVTGTTGGVSGGDNASLNSFNDAGVMQIQIGGEFTVRGRDLVTVLDQQNIRSQRTG